MPYAERTTVPVDRTMAELGRLLDQHGATGFAYGRDSEQQVAHVVFRLRGRLCRFSVDAPSAAQYGRLANGRPRSPRQAQEKAEAEHRRRWRAKYMLTKALLVAVQDGDITLDEAFLPFMLLPDGSTVAQWAEPQFDRIDAGMMPPLLPGVQTMVLSYDQSGRFELELPDE
jgi:hypothetical protein